jgi:hypothetical protein
MMDTDFERVQAARQMVTKAQKHRASYQTMHGLHVLLSLITAGFWIPIWALVAWSNARERRRADRWQVEAQAVIDDALLSRQIQAPRITS